MADTQAKDKRVTRRFALRLPVTVRYGERVVLDCATLAIDEGDRIGLVGRSTRRRRAM